MNRNQTKRESRFKYIIPSFFEHQLRSSQRAPSARAVTGINQLKHDMLNGKTTKELATSPMTPSSGVMKRADQIGDRRAKELVTSPLNPASATFRPGRTQHPNPLLGGAAETLTQKAKRRAEHIIFNGLASSDTAAQEAASHEPSASTTIKVYSIPLPTPQMAIPELCYFVTNDTTYCRLPGDAPSLPMEPYKPPNIFSPPEQHRHPQTTSISPGSEAVLDQPKKESPNKTAGAIQSGPPLNAPTEPAAMRKHAKVPDERNQSSAAVSSGRTSSIFQCKASEPDQQLKMSTATETLLLTATAGASHSQSRVWVSESARLAKDRQKTVLGFRRIGAQDSPACPKSNSEYLELAKFNQEYQAHKLKKRIVKAHENRIATGEAENGSKTPEPSSLYLPTLTDIDTTINDAIKDGDAEFDEQYAKERPGPLHFLAGKKFKDGKSPMFVQDLCWNDEDIESIPEDMRVTWPSRAELTEHSSRRYLGEDRSLPYPRQNQIADKFDPTQAVYDDDGKLNAHYRKIKLDRLGLRPAADNFHAAPASRQEEEEPIDESEVSGPLQDLLRTIDEAGPFDTMPKKEKN